MVTQEGKLEDVTVILGDHVSKERSGRAKWLRGPDSCVMCLDKAGTVFQENSDWPLEGATEFYRLKGELLKKST